MKQLITLLLALLVGFHTTAQHETEVVQTLNLREERITAVLEGKINIIEWQEPYIQVKTIVYVDGFKKEIIERLVATDRYKLTEIAMGGVLFIEAPNTKKYIIIKNNDLLEDFEYEIYVPEGTTVTTPDRMNQPLF